MSDAGWRRGDEAAWWDASARCWRRGTLVGRRTVPTFEYDVNTPHGVVSIPERLLRSVLDPALSEPLAATLGPAPTPPPAASGTVADRSAPALPASERPVPVDRPFPKFRPGETLAERTRR